ASSRASDSIWSRRLLLTRRAGTVCVVISRLTETSRPTAPRLSAPTPASTRITNEDARKIFEARRMKRERLSVCTTSIRVPLMRGPDQVRPGVPGAGSCHTVAAARLAQQEAQEGQARPTRMAHDGTLPRPRLQSPDA